MSSRRVLSWTSAVVCGAGVAVTGIVGLAAAQRGTPAEAKAMLQKAIAYYKSVGRKQALADFSGKKPPFFDRDLYVVCIGPDDRLTANGALPTYVGQSVDVFKDADGKSLGRAFVDAAARQVEGIVRYPMLNPVSGKVEAKVAFVQKVGEDVCGVGAYQAQ